MRRKMALVQEVLDERIGLSAHQEEAFGVAHDRSQLHPHVPFARRWVFGFKTAQLLDHFRYFIDTNEVELFTLHFPERVNTDHETRRILKVGRIGRIKLEPKVS